MKDKILVTARSFCKTEGPHRQILADAGFQLIENPDDRPLEPTELIPLVSDAVAVILGLDHFTAAVIEHAHQLKVISRYGVGVDNVDIPAATRRGIAVTITPGANSIAVAELTLGLMLALARQIPQHNALLKQKHWQRTPGVEVAGATLGVVGMGRIGQEVARRATGFAMYILYSDPIQPPAEIVAETGAISLPLEELLAASDFVSLHVPLTPETHYLINRQTLALMKPSAYLINTARGGLVDQEALYETLIDHKLAGAASDVFASEPPQDNPLIQLNNFIATPHIGATTVQTIQRMGLMAAKNALAVLRGERPPDTVNPEVFC